jgi:hypothetical protein
MSTPDLYVELRNIMAEHRLHRDHWAAGRAGMLRLLTLRESWGGYVIPVHTPQPVLFGLSVELDPLLPPDTIELRDMDGSVQGSIKNIG